MVSVITHVPVQLTYTKYFSILQVTAPSTQHTPSSYYQQTRSFILSYYR